MDVLNFWGDRKAEQKEKRKKPMRERLIDNIILYVLGIFLMFGMSGWVRPVIVVLIALLYVSVSDLMPKDPVRYIEMGAFVVIGVVMSDHALMLFLPLLVYDSVRMRSWKAYVITGIGALCQVVWFIQGGMDAFHFALWCFTLVLAAILCVRTKRSLKLAQEVIHLKDSSTELRIVMQKRQQDLLEKQDYEVHLATLQERNVKYCFLAIAKEALANVVRHSNATHVSLYFCEHPGFYQMLVEDNGTDIKVKEAQIAKAQVSGIGLSNMRDRVEALGGTISFLTDKGFEIRISVPKMVDAKG